MKTIHTLVASAILLAANTFADSNDIWSATIDAEFSLAPLPNVVEEIESKSRSADPNHNGVHILFPDSPGANHPRVSLNLRRISIRDTIQYISEVSGLRPIFSQDTVILAQRSESLEWFAFHGKCSDAVDGKPIGQLFVKSGSEVPAQIATDTNGHYVCALPTWTETSYFDQAEIIDHASETGGTIEVWAPGYQLRVYPKPTIAGPGLRALNIELYPCEPIPGPEQ